MWDVVSVAASWLVCVLAIEAITEIITSSKLFAPVRNWAARGILPNPDIAPPNPATLPQSHYFWIWFQGLITCGYCTSVWVALVVAWYAPIPEVSWLGTIPAYFIKVFALHRLANLFHIWFEIVRRGRVKTYDFKVSATIDGNTQGVIGGGNGNG
jgi:hypothetical protein